MAQGIIHPSSPFVQELVNLSGSRTTGDGIYIDSTTSQNNHYNQIHIHQCGRMIEMNIVTTLNGPMSVGTFYTFATTILKPIYTVRAEGYGAQSTSDYAVQEGIVSLSTNGNLNFTPYSAVASGGQRTFRFNIVYMLSDEVITGGSTIMTSPTDQLAARVAALEDKCTMKTLVNIQSEDTLDGIYFYNRTPRLSVITQERVTQYGNIISFRLYGTLKAVNDSGTNEAWSALGNSLKTLCTTSLIPVFPYRFPVSSSNDQGTIIGVLSIAASNGQISFEPTVRMTSSGTTFTTLPAGNTMGFMVHGTYPLTAME